MQHISLGRVQFLKCCVYGRFCNVTEKGRGAKSAWLLRPCDPKNVAVGTREQKLLVNRNELPLLGEEGVAETQSKKPATGKAKQNFLQKENHLIVMTKG